MRPFSAAVLYYHERAARCNQAPHYRRCGSSTQKESGASKHQSVEMVDFDGGMLEKRMRNNPVTQETKYCA